MGFLSPSVPKPLPSANPAVNPPTAKAEAIPGVGVSSLLSASAAGLKRKGELNKTSLIGGG